MNAPKSQIIGTGSYVPEKVLTNADLEKLVDTSDQWIVERTGIRERRVAAAGESSQRHGRRRQPQGPGDGGRQARGARSDHRRDHLRRHALAVLRRLRAGQAGGRERGGLRRRRGLRRLALRACRSPTTSSRRAEQARAGGGGRAADPPRRLDRSQHLRLFGDAAGAMVLAPEPAATAASSRPTSTPTGATAEILYIPAGGSRSRPPSRRSTKRLHFVKMNGREVYKVAVRSLTDGAARGAGREQAHRRRRAARDRAPGQPAHPRGGARSASTSRCRSAG